jgi:hypothetical protein
MLGRPSVVAFALLLSLGGWLASLAPFSLDPPSRVDNAATLVDGVASFAPIGLVQVLDVVPRLRAVAPDDDVVVYLRVRSARADQFGPARLLTISEHLQSQTLVIGQEGPNLLVRTFQIRAGKRDIRRVAVPDGLPPGEWVDLRVTLSDGTLSVQIGDQVAERRGQPPVHELVTARTRMSLGAELSGTRPWHGDIARAELWLDNERIDLLDPSRASVPDRLWVLPDRLDHSAIRSPRSQLEAAALHVLFGLVLGASMVASLPRLRRPTTVMVGWAVAVVVLNLLKIFVATRHPSAATTGLQIGAGWLGITFALAVRHRLQRRADES